MRSLFVMVCFTLTGCAETGPFSLFHGGSLENAFDIRPSRTKQLDMKIAQFEEANKAHCVISEDGYVSECGLIDELMDHDPVFIACAKAKTKSVECGKNLDMYYAKIALRYELADFKKVDLICMAQGGCTSREKEIKILLSHNSTASRRWFNHWNSSW